MTDLNTNDKDTYSDDIINIGVFDTPEDIKKFCQGIYVFTIKDCKKITEDNDYVKLKIILSIKHPETNRYCEVYDLIPADLKWKLSQFFDCIKMQHIYKKEGIFNVKDIIGLQGRAFFKWNYKGNLKYLNVSEYLTY